MKKMLLHLLMAAAFCSLNAQRLVPVFESGYSVDNMEHGPDGAIYDLESHQGNLYFSGDFSSFTPIQAMESTICNTVIIHSGLPGCLISPEEK
jgi:hypothetical protein